ncbi:MAG: YopX family protein [Nanoarchaeota archaeon]
MENLKREIKFKAWDTENKIWLEYITLSLNGIMMTTDGYKIIPMQYTGVFDIHKKEVCEGDIISHKSFSSKQRSIVRWQKDKGGFNCWIPNENDWGTDNWINIPYNREVIGNIYTDSYLLKK